MVAKNATGAELTVAEKNGKMVEALVYANGIIAAAVNALGECGNAEQANRLLRKACGDVAERLKGARHA